mmetsp:Transcript_22566/g.48983  ORF Transcript_22566/g.48983 Transcript_22566/m.48983 type:complete len:133 (+) Transcript_22566:183-581(+)
MGAHVMNVDDDKLGIQGYCPVAYFFGPPQKGLEELSSEYEGVIYRFASSEALAMFEKEPDKWAPLYGGWCGTGMAHGSLTPIDPLNFLIENGRLLLFFKNEELDTKVMWEKDAAGSKAQADKNWETNNYVAK